MHSAVFTKGVALRIEESEDFIIQVLEAMYRFTLSDWGDVGAVDWAQNDLARRPLIKGEGGRIIAAYGEGEDKIWIIADLEAVTILFPSEY